MTMARGKKADLPPPSAEFIQYTSYGLSPAEMESRQGKAAP